MELLESSHGRIDNLQIIKTDRDQITGSPVQNTRFYMAFTDLFTVFECDRNGMITFSNRYGFDLFGFSQDDIDRGLNVLQTVAPDDRERARQNIAEKLRGEEIKNNMYTMLKRDGNTFPAVILSNSIFRNGVYMGFRGIVVELGDPEKAEEMFYRSGTIYRAIFENTGTAMVITGEDMTIDLVNAEFERLSGYGREEIEGMKNFTEFIFPDDLDMVTQFHALRNSDRAAAPRHYEFRFYGRDKVVLNIYLSVDVIPEANKHILSLIDITERKRSEALFKEQEKALEHKTNNLKEINTALKILVEHRDYEKKVLEDTIIMNVNRLIIPYIEKLDLLLRDEDAITYLSILKANFEQIITPFSHRLTEKTMQLTPKEIQIADLIAKGKTTKEIASLLSLSADTIMANRKNIRKKLGLKYQKTNLRSYLQSLLKE